MPHVDDPSMSHAPPAVGDALPADSANAAGDALRAAREAAGLSIDAVAQQLKLAPRQVIALETGDYAGLPGRTFVRGFARNYARLMQLDADAIVAALPDASAAPALERPTLGSGTQPMGAFEERPRRSVARIAIPLLLIGLIGIAALYELDRSGRLDIAGWRRAPATPAPPDPVMPPSLPGGSTPLPNPLGAPETKSSAQESGLAQTPSSAAPAADAPATPAPSVPIGGTASAPPANTSATPAAAPSSAATRGAGSATLVIVYRAPSWTEVRDGNGQRLLVGTMAANSTQTITGTPPFEVVLGNVSQTTVTWRGSTVDTSAWHRQNVARLQLD